MDQIMFSSWQGELVDNRAAAVEDRKKPGNVTLPAEFRPGERIKAFIVPEINCGQIVYEVERCAGGAADTVLIPHMGGGVHRPEVIIDAIRKAAR